VFCRVQNWNILKARLLHDRRLASLRISFGCSTEKAWAWSRFEVLLSVPLLKAHRLLRSRCVESPTTVALTASSSGIMSRQPGNNMELAR
jgi:hypothetical protein